MFLSKVMGIQKLLPSNHVMTNPMQDRRLMALFTIDGPVHMQQIEKLQASALVMKGTWGRSTPSLPSVGMRVGHAFVSSVSSYPELNPLTTAVVMCCTAPSSVGSGSACVETTDSLLVRLHPRFRFRDALLVYAMYGCEQAVVLAS
jgi:hypothetical protein